MQSYSTKSGEMNTILFFLVDSFIIVRIGSDKKTSAMNGILPKKKNIAEMQVLSIL
jgi:hypothetical protein